MSRREHFSDSDTDTDVRKQCKFRRLKVIDSSDSANDLDPNRGNKSTNAVCSLPATKLSTELSVTADLNFISLPPTVGKGKKDVIDDDLLLFSKPATCDLESPSITADVRLSSRPIQSASSTDGGADGSCFRQYSSNKSPGVDRSGRTDRRSSSTKSPVKSPGRSFRRYSSSKPSKSPGCGEGGFTSLRGSSGKSPGMDAPRSNSRHCTSNKSPGPVGGSDGFTSRRGSSSKSPVVETSSHLSRRFSSSKSPGPVGGSVGLTSRRGSASKPLGGGTSAPSTSTQRQTTLDYFQTTLTEGIREAASPREFLTDHANLRTRNLPSVIDPTDTDVGITDVEDFNPGDSDPDEIDDHEGFVVDTLAADLLSYPGDSEYEISEAAKKSGRVPIECRSSDSEDSEDMWSPELNP